MSTRQFFVRFALMAPSILLMLLFLPIKGGGYQYAGILDPDFLTSGSLDYSLLAVEVIVLLVLAAVLEQFARPNSGPV